MVLVSQKRNNAYIKRAIFALVMSLNGLTAQADVAADKVIKAVRERPDGKNWISQVDLIISNGGQARTRKMLFLKKSDGLDEKYVMYFESPSDVKGVAFLNINYDEHAGKDDDLWMFLPAYKQVRRVSATDKRGSFMGSQFNYYDLDKFRVSDFNQKILRHEKIMGVDTTVIERTPANEKTTNKSGYSKIIVWVDTARALALQQKYYDEAGVVFKTQTVRKVETIQGYLTPTEIEVELTNESKKTLMIFQKTVYDTNLSDTLFQQNSLTNGANFERLSTNR